MNIKIAIKSPSTRKVNFTDWNLNTSPQTFKELLESIVTICVNTYNNQRKEHDNIDPAEKTDNLDFLKLLTTKELNDAAQNGKVSFGEIYNSKHQNLDEAIKNANIAFEDGLFAAFIDDQQIEQLEQSIALKENAQVTFIRLTFLAGRMW